MKYLLMSLATLGLLASSSAGEARAGLVFTSDPLGAWSYRYAADAGHPSTTYYPTSTAEYQQAAFQGFVRYNSLSEYKSSLLGVFGPIYDDLGDTFQIFTTTVLSSQDVTISILFGGDDGHSLFVNDLFVGGGGFGVDVAYDLFLKAGVPTKLELAGHNGPGSDWVFGITAPDQVDGVGIAARGFAVPEASTMSLLVIGFTTLIGYSRLRAEKDRKSCREPILRIKRLIISVPDNFFHFVGGEAIGGAKP